MILILTQERNSLNIVFSIQVWMFLAICFIGVAVLLTLFKYIYGRFFEGNVSVDVGSQGYQSYSYLFTVLTNQGNE